ncbi:DUF3108 domain-containing protein [Pokkaliibacter sp. CJK22405]|uniref:DUF3108 domain-containing protein n=1 Tax=Pokkaliibacter sp. CJK22405 TaxID=3384615 RepID=UPI0039849D8C
MKTFWIALLLIVAPSSYAAPLEAFKAEYSAEIDAGIELNAKATRTLTQIDATHWKLDIFITHALASLRETTTFEVKDNSQVVPTHYEFLRKVLGSKRQAILDFDWNKNRVHNLVQSKPWSMDIPADAQDKLSYQAQLLFDINKGAKTFTYPVAGGGKLEDYRFRITGQEQVKTPAGTFDTVVLKRVREEDANRETTIWLAPSLNYQIVKLEQIEKDDKTYRLLLESLK